MEDSVGVEERREQSETTPHKRARQDGGKAGEEGGGFLSAMASKIGAATMPGTNGSGGGGEASATVASSDGEARDGNGNGEAAGEEGGFLSSMASKIGAAMMSGANGSGGNASGAMEAEEARDQDVAGEQAGFLSAVATKIGMAMSGANDGVDSDDSHGGSGDDDARTSNNGEAARGSTDGEEKKKGEEANGGGGILTAVASKIGVAVSGAASGNGNHSAEDDDAKKSTGDAGHGSKGEEGTGKQERDVSGGGIVEQIISKLPSDDQAPDADEASLLIHIIED